MKYRVEVLGVCIGVLEKKGVEGGEEKLEVLNFEKVIAIVGGFSILEFVRQIPWERLRMTMNSSFDRNKELRFIPVSFYFE